MGDFLSAMLSSEGKVSSNRVCMFLCVLFLLIWTTIAVVKNGIIPDVSPGWYTLIGIFVTGSLGAKATEAAKSFGGKTDETEPPPT